MNAETFRPGDRVRVVGGSTTPPEWVGEGGVVVDLNDRERLLHHPVGPMVELDDGTRVDFLAEELVRDDAYTVTVRPVSEASTASLTFTLTTPTRVAVSNEYGDTVQYSLRELLGGLLELWARGVDDTTAAAR